MSHQTTPLRELPLQVLLERLTFGWSGGHSGAAEDLVRRLRLKLACHFEITAVEHDALTLEAELTGIHLRGLHEVPCLLMSGAGNPVVAADFLRRSTLPRVIPFVLTLSEEAYGLAREVFQGGRFLVLARAEIKELLTSDSALVYLTNRLREQIPRGRLMPYNILLPADEVIFFGRQGELERLCNDESNSYAIAGPGRVGKTSLVKRYESEMRRRRDPRQHCRMYVTFLDCNDKTSDGVARFISMRVTPSRRSSSVDTDTLLASLKYQSRALEGPLDLLLDEVDLVCQTKAFAVLGEAARADYCRLILCGRGDLLKTMLDEESPLAKRLKLIRLGPLDPEAATGLAVKPLTDLGFVFEDQAAFVERILNLTGGLPHLIQYYGEQLSLLAAAGGGNTIRMEHIDELMNDFINAQFLIQPLNDLKDPETRLAGLVLVKEGENDFKDRRVQEIMARFKVHLPLKRLQEVCNDLVINNVLTWHNGSYRIANEGLGHYARQGGYIDAAIDEALGEVRVLSSAPFKN